MSDLCPQVTARTEVVWFRERTDLSSGARFQIVQRYLDPGEVETELAGLGWQRRAAVTDTFFPYGTATDRRR